MNKRRRQHYRVRDFIDQLSESDKELLDYYIEYEYTSRIRTGKGKLRNFYAEHNSEKGIEIIKELLKFKRLVQKAKQEEKKKNNKNK